MIEAMPEAQERWAEMQRRLGRLPAERQAVVALAGAERLVGVTASVRESELRLLLAQGWAAVTGSRDLSRLREGLLERDDLDDDEVAAVTFALGAVMGSVQDAWWAVSRCLDAAFDRVPYPDDATSFRPVEEDAASPGVRREMEWHLAALSVAEESDSLPAAIERLRAVV